MSDMETTAEERDDVLEAIHDGDIDIEDIWPVWFDKLFRDLDRVIARIAELDASIRAAVLAEREACAAIGDKNPYITGNYYAAVIRARPAP